MNYIVEIILANFLFFWNVLHKYKYFEKSHSLKQSINQTINQSSVNKNLLNNLP